MERKSAAARAIHLKRSNPAEVLSTNMALDEGEGNQSGEDEQLRRVESLPLFLRDPLPLERFNLHSLLEDETDNDSVPKVEEASGTRSKRVRGGEDAEGTKEPNSPLDQLPVTRGSVVDALEDEETEDRDGSLPVGGALRKEKRAKSSGGSVF